MKKILVLMTLAGVFLSACAPGLEETLTNTAPVETTVPVTEKPTETPTQEPTPTQEVLNGESLEFPRGFEPAESSIVRYEANVDGLKIPIFGGVREEVTILSELNPEPMKKWFIRDQEAVDTVGYAFLDMCRFKYNQINGTNLTHDEYITLLKQGQGRFDVAAVNGLLETSELRLRTVDPLQGFSTFAAIDGKNMPITILPMKFMVAVDGKGRLMLGSDMYKYAPVDYADQGQFGIGRDAAIVEGIIDQNFSFFYEIDNECFLKFNGDVYKGCGNDWYPRENATWFKPQVDLNMKYKEKILSGEMPLPYQIEWVK